jgi:hypothetical protein
MTGQADCRTMLSNQVERMLRALPEADKRDVGPLTGGHRSDVLDLDLTRDHLVAQPDHDRGDQGQAVLAFVGDQDPQVSGVTVGHKPLHAGSSLVVQRFPPRFRSSVQV